MDVDAQEPGVSEETSDRERLVRLRQTLTGRFSLEELRTPCCFDLGVNYDGLSGEGTAAKARELVNLFERRRRIPALEEAIERGMI